MHDQEFEVFSAETSSEEFATVEVGCQCGSGSGCSGSGK
jgi:hypothetical protein